METGYIQHVSSVVRSVSAILNSTAVGALTTTTGTLLVPGRPGHFYLPLTFAVRKTAGAAYTINSSAAIAVGHLTSGYYLQLTSAGLMDQTDETQKYRTFAAIAATGDNTATYVGKSLGVLVSTGSFTGAGSDVVVNVCYLDIQVP